MIDLFLQIAAYPRKGTITLNCSTFMLTHWMALQLIPARGR